MDGLLSNINRVKDFKRRVDIISFIIIIAGKLLLLLLLGFLLYLLQISQSLVLFLVMLFTLFILSHGLHSGLSAGPTSAGPAK